MGERTWGKGACMNPAIVIPSYWAADAVDAQAPGAYDHSTDLNAPKPELDACLASLEQVRDVCRVIVLVVSPPSSADAARERVRAIARSHPALTVTVLTEREAARIRDRVVAVRGDEDHRERVLELAERLGELDARRPRHGDVQEHDVDTALHQHLDGGANARRLGDRAHLARLLQKEAQLGACRRLIVDDHRT